MPGQSASTIHISLCITAALCLIQFAPKACPPRAVLARGISPHGEATRLAAAAKEKDRSSDSIKSSLDYLRAYGGKYPREVALFDNPVLEKRLKRLLGDRYGYLRSIWDVETPIEIRNDLFYAWAMQAHNGGDPGAVIMADLKKNVLYAGIRQDGRVTFYSEDGSAVPQRLTDWSNE